MKKTEWWRWDWIYSEHVRSPGNDRCHSAQPTMSFNEKRCLWRFRRTYRPLARHQRHTDWRKQTRNVGTTLVVLPCVPLFPAEPLGTSLTSFRLKEKTSSFVCAESTLGPRDTPRFEEDSCWIGQGGGICHKDNVDTCMTPQGRLLAARPKVVLLDDWLPQQGNGRVFWPHNRANLGTLVSLCVLRSTDKQHLTQPGNKPFPLF